ncbi:MAG: M48 family metallopeptidase [Planctomycetota bacterium]
MPNRTLNSLLNAAYLAVLVVSAAVFYAVTLGLVVGLLGAAYFLCAGFTIRGKAVEILVIAGFLAYLVLRETLRSPRNRPIRIRGDRDRFPRLFGILDEVAENVNTRQVDEVFITPDSRIGVREGGGLLGLLGRSHRILELGIAGLHLLTLPELKAILAHEYAHFTSRETLFRRFVARVLSSLQSALARLRDGRLWRISPFYRLLQAYEFFFRYFATTFCRQREYAADRLAAQCYGGNVLASGLVNFACASALFEGPAYGGLFRLLLEGRMMRNLYSAFRAYSHTISPDDLDHIRREVLRDRSGLLDSHPCPARRIGQIRGVNRLTDPPDDGARNIFEDPAKVEVELSTLLTGRFMGGLGLLDSLRPSDGERTDRM